MYSCIYHLLKQRKLVHSLSVYSAEVGFDSKSAILTEEDVVKALNLGVDSPVYQAVVNNVDNGSTSTEDGERRNVLDLLIENTYRLSNNNRVDMAIQTDLIVPFFKEVALQKLLKSCLPKIISEHSFNISKSKL